MTTQAPRTGLQLRSLARANGELELSLADVPVPDPLPDEVLVRVEAAPLNPSDLGLLFGAADMSTATYGGTTTHPVVTATIPAARMRAVAGRLDQSLPVGNEGAGIVVAAGVSPEAQALLGKTVAAIGGAMYLAVPHHQGRAVPGPAGRYDGGGGRVVLCQPADLARNGRNDATRGA